MSKHDPAFEASIKQQRIVLTDLLSEVRACRICQAVLEPNPVVRASVDAELLIIGQAPGTRVHATGIPWNDPSGDRLRSWLSMDKSDFYDEAKVAIIPMGFCYPGKGKSGDLPPRPECAEAWHARLLALLPKVRLTLLVGSYAQNYYLGRSKKKTLTETVKNYREYLEKGFLPIPHPSPRNTLWLKKNPWFEDEVVTEMRRHLRGIGY
ncbi:uracil-DNA glycosylase family protein [Litoribrevibacter albus]|uniref:Uracil-DNA glycosylase n=1 Tax=Litoribrevibacter albus TaxID=1473156 RepID=A0AA37SB98_9GAMM|nr:uracil-DNA glycosylase family protein [Litoribrevibacter albus]GLQ32116.1 uracil-DNA glycosylase [Litoribrevibacter albus]